MLAVIKQAIPEAIKGLSTGFIVWAGSSPCSPQLVCAVCPDCICTCDGTTRRGPAPAALCRGDAWLVVVALLALVAGTLLGYSFALCSVREQRRAGGKGARGVVLQLA